MSEARHEMIPVSREEAVKAVMNGKRVVNVTHLHTVNMILDSTGGNITPESYVDEGLAENSYFIVERKTRHRFMTKWECIRWAQSSASAGSLVRSSSEADWVLPGAFDWMKQEKIDDVERVAYGMQDGLSSEIQKMEIEEDDI